MHNFKIKLISLNHLTFWMSIFVIIFSCANVLFIPLHIIIAFFVIITFILITWFTWKKSKFWTNKEFKFNIFFIGLSIRIVAMTILFYVLNNLNGSPFLLGEAGDDYIYDKLSWELASSWKEGVNYEIPAGMVGYKGYIFFNAFFYFLFGHNLIVTRLINCFFGALIIIYIFKVANKIYEEKIARLSAILVTYFPTLIIWSCLQYKDTLLTFLVILAIYLTIKFKENLNINTMIKIFLLIFIIYTIRLQAAVTLSFLIITFLILDSKFINKLKLSFIILSFCLMIFLVIQNNGQISYLLALLERGPEFLNTRFQQFTSIESVSIKTFFSNLFLFPIFLLITAVLPIPTLFTLPTPYDFLNKLEISGSFIWQLFLPFFIIGFFYSIKFKFKESFLIYSWIIVSLIGLLFLFFILIPRHRLQIIPLNLIFTTVGFFYLDIKKLNMWLLTFYIIYLPVSIIAFNLIRLQLHGLL